MGSLCWLCTNKTATIQYPAETIALDLYSNSFFFLLLGKLEVFAPKLCNL